MLCIVYNFYMCVFSSFFQLLMDPRPEVNMTQVTEPIVVLDSSNDSSILELGGELYNTHFK